MVDYIDSEEALLAHYGMPKLPSTVKVSPVVTPHYREWIEASPFCALASVGPEGLDCSPRGDAGPVVRILDEKTIAMPDRRGNDRIDTLRNIVRDPRVSLMFLIPGSGTVLRVNGRARITSDEALRESFAMDGKLPRTVTVVKVDEVYFQCARAVVRSNMWQGGHADPATLPSIGLMLETLSSAAIDGKEYDAEWPGRAAKTMW
ncbi:pyridoxamine 5'-phosphate oxidase family protein [Acuticoccus kandeliae]|uniref:pyridoxamine 5'-phosphate oxidase family protein n=1 Tax=Acuticoccus kandeliae TaxID=2073160 RepID=UPI000D3E98FA|nr:pyridoxamine 5'-phosphate oxidase family protein [Acuticoccus kandeliae]